jgi:uncharacterized protein YcbX
MPEPAPDPVVPATALHPKTEGGPARSTVTAVRVQALWRHPVKSMQGERVEAVQVHERGVAGDRRYGVLDRAGGTIMSAKRWPQLLEARALQTGPELVVRLPNGETVLGLGAGSDAALSAWLDRSVHLQEATDETAGTYESRVDPTDDESEVVQWTGPEGSFVDSAPVHLLTTASLAHMTATAPPHAWDVRRFRPNVLIDVDDAEGFVEDDWVGATLYVGDVELHVTKRADRCAMIGREQPDGLRRDTGVIRALAETHDLCLGVMAEVRGPGPVRVGDAVRVERA